MQPRRFFTVAQANRALPLVRQIVADLQEAWKALREARRRAAEGPEAGREHFEAKAFDLEGKVEGFLQELHNIGCEVKDVETGLLDFFARRGDTIVCLCWKAGEERVEWWHDLEAGFRGRRPVRELPAATRGEDG